ncbi:MAG: biopolymer transporter ExbD [Melioribacteraceae bacterium]|nr:biopolymer transporter ExbD [Melioribacteraceae bacterium]
MRNSTFLIRFIDVGLIILFGFIVISEITVRSQIELPGSEPNESEEKRDLTLFVINIDPDNRYRLTDFEEETLYGSFTGINNLESYLRNLRNEIINNGKSPVALIELDETVTMQRLINVLDLCDQIGIPKNVNVDSFRL